MNDMREHLAQRLYKSGASEEYFHAITKQDRPILDPERALADAIIAALPDMVKPLEWLGGGKRHHAGNYVIEDISTPRREIRRLLHASFGTTYLADFGGDRPLEAAKAAAQAHRTADILSALGVQGGEA